MYNNLEIENGQEQHCKFYVVKSLLGGWKLGGWMDGWMDGWMGGKAGLRIAYSNQ